MHAWAALVIGVVIGLLIGFRAGTMWFPTLLGRVETWAIRGRVSQYKRRRRR